MKQNVAILIFDEVEVLDFAGPFEVFAVSDELCDYTAFNVFTVGLLPGTVRARHGLKLVPDHTLETCPAPHVLIIPGGHGTRALLTQPVLLEWIRMKARRAGLVMSVCTGALVLAQAGLLHGLRVTTHHEMLATLAVLAPSATVDPSARFHDNPAPDGQGRILTAAGISAGIDCSLHAIRLLLGPAVAEQTARYMEYEA